MNILQNTKNTAVGVLALCVGVGVAAVAFVLPADASSTIDPVPGAPYIISVTSSGTTLTVTTSEAVYAPNPVGQYDFMLSNCLGESLDDGVVSGLGTTAATADNSFTVTFSKGTCTGDRLIYSSHRNTTDNQIRDVAGNWMPMQGNRTDGNIINGGGIQPPVQNPHEGDDNDDGSGQTPQDPTPPAPTEGVTEFGNLVISGSTARFTFKYACTGAACDDNYNASYVFTDTITCDSTVGGNTDVTLTDIGNYTKRSSAIDVSDADGKYMCVKVSDHNVGSNFYKSYQMPAQIQEVQDGAGITPIGHNNSLYTSPSTDPNVVVVPSDTDTVVLPPTAAERIELAKTTTSTPTLMALVPLHPVAVAKNPICPVTVLTQLHTSSRKWVRYWVARHRSTTTEVLNTLANDSDSEVAQAAKNNLNSR